MSTTITNNNISFSVFGKIQDQDTAIRILINSIKENRISHAYLFWGPDGVGKKFTAKSFAQTVLCQNIENPGCGTCSICTRIGKDVHPDVSIIKPMGKTRLISVETIEDVNKTTQFQPYEGKRRFIIFDDAERIGIPAQNHFLKTLEEPVSETTFILISSNPGMILPTIRSRCQPIRFQRLRSETITTILNNTKDISLEEAKRVALLSQGQISRAFEILESNKRTIIVELFARLAEGKDPLILTNEFEQFLSLIRKNIENELNKIDTINKKDLTPGELNALQQQITAEIEAQVVHEFESCLYLIVCLLRDILVYMNTKNLEILYFPEMVSYFPRWDVEKVEMGLDFVEKVRGYIARNISRDKVIRDLFFMLSPHIN
ncbi:MAG TPA: DNA polymerase III subunit delta' [Candidatus Hydrogenedens sp.]|nr:DNA polymerase III subunit delta' [Candidatus Hydrogenedens sp.]HOL19659.1 DNA polymerase III subunit delta' [Candidatus Hydrogenedens sp.]HPP57725.1 DNA polymerase III subunit delta' [Candidatus Hydrogenedens sp.]